MWYVKGEQVGKLTICLKIEGQERIGKNMKENKTNSE